MPVHLAPVSRRAFVAQLGGAALFRASVVTAKASEQRVDPDRIAILNDTHIGEHHAENAPIPTRLRQTVAWLVGLQKLPAAVIVNGDLALSDGQPGDYRRLAELIAPLRHAGISVHLTLGNHDNRDVFFHTMASEITADPPVLSKHVGLVPLAKANLFLLDSLKGPHHAQGSLGLLQLQWLGQMLDTHVDKPALIFAHHNPRLGGEEKFYPGGLEDSTDLWDLLVSRPQVKAYVHGHLHQRSYSLHRSIHIIDTPATSFVRRPEESTTGWTMVQFTDLGGEFTTLTHHKTHAWNRAIKNLSWR